MNSNQHPAPAAATAVRVAPHTSHGPNTGIAGLPGYTPADVCRRGRFARLAVAATAATAAAVLAGGVAAAFITLAGPTTTPTDTAAATFSTSHHGPSVTSFSANHPTCKAGAGGATLKLSWTITGAHSATVAVDGLGEYGEYTSSSVKLNIPCDGEAHVYHVWPTGSQNALKTLTVKPSYEKARS